MPESVVDRIVNALLYEGYVLYPYRPAVKNRQRWTFGGLYPRAYSEAQTGTDAWKMQTECLVRGGERTTVRVKVRFLHLIARLIGAFDPPRQYLKNEEAPTRLVDSLQVDGLVFQTWQEALEREAALPPWHVAAETNWQTFAWDASRRQEPIRADGQNIVGLVVREQEAVSAAVRLEAESVADGLFKIRVEIENRSTLDAGTCTRDTALMRSLVSTHAILEADNGEFLSLLDPPDEARALAESCRNIGAWPVLVGEPGQRDTILAAPIILYDYPQIAPQSPGDLFDGTEIDEILSLRILTLTEEERRQAAGLDDRVRALLARTETLDRGLFAGMHGVMHPVSPSQEKAT